MTGPCVRRPLKRLPSRVKEISVGPSGPTLSVSFPEVSFLVELQMLNVDGFHHLCTLLDRRLFESLAVAEFADRSGLLKLPLELLESSLYVLAFLDRYYDHSADTSFFLGAAKVEIVFISAKFFRRIV